MKGIDRMDLEEYLKRLADPISNEQKRIEATLSIERVQEVVRRRWDLLSSYIANDNPEWKKIIPGRVVCHKFCSVVKMDTGRFKTMYINQAREEDLTPFNDILDIFKSFESSHSKGG